MRPKVTEVNRRRSNEILKDEPSTPLGDPLGGDLRRGGVQEGRGSDCPAFNVARVYPLPLHRRWILWPT